MTSRLLILLNRLKAAAYRDWLTDSQSAAFSEIQTLWDFPERINLTGLPGAGKTFLAWTVARLLGAAYFPSPRVYHTEAVPQQVRVVIDNTSDDAIAQRRLLAELQLNSSRSALIITTQPNRLGLPVVALARPTSQDLDIVYRNLSLLDYYSLNPHYAENLWMVVAQVL